MPVHLLAQVSLNRTSNLPEDRVINTFHFEVQDNTQLVADAATIVSRLTEFYTVAPPGFAATLQGKLSAVISLIGHTIKVYDMSQPQPRIPIVTSDLVLNGVTGNGLPSEVALVLSFRGVAVAGVPPARRRGRVYLGPFGTAAMGSIVDGDMRPSPDMTSILNGIGARLGGYQVGPIWSVYSEVANNLVNVAFVSTDNAFDTQRRRGARRTSRTEVPA
jgi:hypothetical protein